MQTQTTPTATVIFFSTERGYGFLRREAAPSADLFVHATALRDVDALTPGQRVTFEEATSRKTGKPCAANVRLVDTGLIEDNRTAAGRMWWQDQ
jgi:cold shock CspA family protein